MADERLDFVAELWVFRQDFFLQFLPVENVRRAKLDFVAHQYAIDLEHFGPKIQVDKQHGHEQADDDGEEEDVHDAKVKKGVGIREWGD